MIYKGTMPARTPGQEGYNVVDMGNTGRGKWGRSLVKGHKSPGFTSKSNQVMLTLGRYWKSGMPEADKAYWVARAAETTFFCRDTSARTVTGYALFVMSNMAALVFGGGMVKVPELELGLDMAICLIHSISAATNQVKLGFHRVLDPPEGWFSEFFFAAVHPRHVKALPNLSFTQLFWKGVPDLVEYDEEEELVFTYLDLPWKVNVGDRVGLYVVERMGSQTGDILWRAGFFYAGPLVTVVTS